VAWIVTHSMGEEDTFGPRTLSAWSGTAWQAAPLHLRPGSDNLHSSAQGPWVVAGDQSMRWGGTDGGRTRVARWTGSAWQDVPMPELKLPPDAKPEHGDVGIPVPDGAHAVVYDLVTQLWCPTWASPE
jgi:hypothetical protein